MKCVDHSSNNIDNHSDSVLKSQWYLLCNYVEKLNDNQKGALYQRRNKNIFIYKESIVYTLIEFEPIYNKKIYFFLVAIDLLKF